MGTVIEYVTLTVSATEPAYIFQIALSDLAIEDLKYYRLFGLFHVAKNKYQFLNDLRDAITEELIVEFKKMIEAEESHRRSS